MIDQWNPIKKYLNYRKHPEDLDIALFGSMEPKSENDFLIRQQNFLIQLGYAGTTLMGDHLNPYSGFDEINRIELTLQFATVNYIIFTKNGHNEESITAFQHVINSKQMVLKNENCVIFDQYIKQKSSIPNVSPYQLKNSGYELIRFSNETDLQEYLEYRSEKFLRKFSDTNHGV